MSGYSKIEWTESSWNPITGCTKFSKGCANCYAERFSIRQQAMKRTKYANGFKLKLHRDCLKEPLKWKMPRVIFVCSMSDLFHEDVPDNFIKEVFKVMNVANWHIFQILTKRAKRLSAIAHKLDWTENIWAGVTVESEEYLDRIDDLRSVPAAIRFISFEPLISKIPECNLDAIDWVIVGGESGEHARPMKPEWAKALRDMCKEKSVPFFFKQWGGKHKKANGRLLDGKIWSQMPQQENIRRNEFILA